MTYITISTPTCFSHAHDFDALVDVKDDLSQLKFDGKSRETILIDVVSFLGFFDSNEVPSDDIGCLLFGYTFQGRIKKWCHSFVTTSIHLFNDMIIELGHSFVFYDHKSLNKKFLKLWKAPKKSIVHFYHHFYHYCFEFPRDEVDWKFLNERFQYLVHISKNPHELEYLECS